MTGAQRRVLQVASNQHMLSQWLAPLVVPPAHNGCLRPVADMGASHIPYIVRTSQAAQHHEATSNPQQSMRLATLSDAHQYT
jgi:hypothetical protein